MLAEGVGAVVVVGIAPKWLVGGGGGSKDVVLIAVVGNMANA